MPVICTCCGKVIQGRMEDHWCDEAQAELMRIFGDYEKAVKVTVLPANKSQKRRIQEDNQ